MLCRPRNFRGRADLTETMRLGSAKKMLMIFETTAVA